MTSERDEITKLLRAHLEILAPYGLVLNEGVSIDDLYAIFEDGSYDADDLDIDLSMSMLGKETVSTPERPLCDRVWWLDTECIYVPGNFVELVLRMARLGGFPVEDVSARFDEDAGLAVVTFTVAGEAHVSTLALNGDWLDEQLLSDLAAIAERHDPGGAIYSLSDGGQDILVCRVASDREFVLDGSDAGWERLCVLGG